MKIKFLTALSTCTAEDPIQAFAEADGVNFGVDDWSRLLLCCDRFTPNLESLLSAFVRDEHTRFPSGGASPFSKE